MWHCGCFKQQKFQRCACHCRSSCKKACSKNRREPKHLLPGKPNYRALELYSKHFYIEIQESGCITSSQNKIALTEFSALPFDIARFDNGQGATTLLERVNLNGINSANLSTLLTISYRQLRGDRLQDLVMKLCQSLCGAVHPLQNRVCTFFLSVVNNASIFKIDNPVRNSALQLQDESLLANSVQDIWLPRMLSICLYKTNWQVE